MRHLLALILVLWPALTTAESRFGPGAAAQLQAGFVTTAETFIVPGYAAYADATAMLESGLRTYCGGAGDIAPARAAFAEAFLAWQRISVIGIGPVMDDKGPMRLQLWPDPKGFSRRAVNTALHAADPALLVPGALEGRSVALVNLMALEDLLYRDLVPGQYACALAVAIAAYQAALAQDLRAGWTASPFRTAFDTAAAGNAQFADIDGLIRAFLAGAVVYTDRLRKFKIARGLGPAPGAARPERTEARKSALGLASIRVGFQALRDLYEVPYGFFDVTPDLGGSMEFFILGEAAGNISAALRVEDRSLADIATADGARAAELRNYGQLLLYHEDYLKQGLPAALGLTAGFTSADGD